MQVTEQQIALISEMTRVRPFLEPALGYTNGTHDYIHLVEGALSGQFHIWPTENSAIVTEFHNFPKERHLHIFLAGGDLEEIKQLHDNVVQFAEAAGCQALTLTGRPGWIKALDDLGFSDNGLRYVRKGLSNE
jgi:hypothetical protein